MATERRPYHRVADSTWSETGSNDVFAFLGRLQGAMHERWRTNRLSAIDACTIRLGATDLCKVAGKRRLDIALKSARSAAEVVTISVRSLGEVTEINWPKWSGFQGLESQHGGKRAPSSPLPRPASSVQRPEEEEELPSVDAEAASPPKDSPLLNLLSRLPGDRAEKAAWLADTGPQIEVDAVSYGKAVPSLTVSYYRRYLAGERRFKAASEAADRKQRFREKVLQWQREGVNVPAEYLEQAGLA